MRPDLLLPDFLYSSDLDAEGLTQSTNKKRQITPTLKFYLGSYVRMKALLLRHLYAHRNPA